MFLGAQITPGSQAISRLRGAAERVARSHGLEIFDVQSHAKAGSDVRKAIKTAMDGADTVVVVSSPHGDASQWVNYEAGLADALGKKLVIVGRGGMGKSALIHRFANTAKVVEFDNVS